MESVVAYIKGLGKPLPRALDIIARYFAEFGYKWKQLQRRLVCGPCVAPS